MKYKMLTKHTAVKHSSNPVSDKMQNFIGSKKIEGEDGKGQRIHESANRTSCIRKLNTTFFHKHLTFPYFHLNVVIGFTIITSLGKWFHFLTVISSRNIFPISV